MDVSTMPHKCPVCGGTGEYQGDIGSKIAWCRKQQGLTQKELADTLEVTRPTIANIETSKQNVTTDVLKKLATLFDVSADWLLGI